MTASPSDPHPEHRQMINESEKMEREKSDQEAAEKYALGSRVALVDPAKYYAFLAGCSHKEEQMEVEISALKQEVAGGSWAFVKQIEELTFQNERLRAALEKLNEHLTIPAAEYVPAIPEAWVIIEAALSPASGESEPGNKGVKE